MTALQVEVAIVGSGTAGMAAFHTPRKLSDSVLLVEAGPYGQALRGVGVHVKMFGAGGGIAGIQDAEIRADAKPAF